MKHTFNHLKKYIAPLLLTFIVGLLVGANYSPGTILSGWDTLHPEFNLPLAFSRIFHGVWRADQGLGAVAIHSHMADVSRTTLLWLTSSVLPMQSLRYSFFFAALLAGVLGMYMLGRRVFPKQKNLFGFLAASTYLMNLGTVSQFIVPFEMFASQYAILPWILWASLRFLAKKDKKTLFLMAFFVILAAPMAYAATLWYAFFGCYVLFLVTYISLQGNQWKSAAKQAGILAALLLIFNSFWILPNMYATITHGADVTNSKVNRMFTPEAFAKNQEFGTLPQVALLKNFLFDWQIYTFDTSPRFTEVLSVWQKNLTNPLVVSIGYGVFILSLLGIVSAARQKDKTALCLLPIYAVSFFVLTNGVWPVNVFFAWLNHTFPVASEAIRFPFTKFSILFMTGISIYSVYGLVTLVHLYSNRKRVLAAVSAAYVVFLTIYFAPAFGGNLIHPSMRISIPQEYFDMFAWFNTQPNDGRVAILPIHSFWNWTYYTWGYQGAGFLQFGIPQPILDRDYDRWSPYNEQYEREMSYAVYSQNPSNIRAVLTKYNVSWVLVDKSVFAPATNGNQTLLWQLDDLLTASGLSAAKKFGENITIYSVPTSQPVSLQPLNPYFSLLDTNERIKVHLSGTVVTEFSGRQYTSVNTPNTDHIDLPTLDHARNYALEIASAHTSGFPLELCVSNSLTSHCDLYVHLGTHATETTERFLLPKLDDFGLGYSLNFNNFTIQGITSVNTIKQIRILELPSGNTVSELKPDMWTTERIDKIMPVLYRVTTISPTKSLVLNESFEPGWIAIRVAPRVEFLSHHVQIRDWANGWTENFGTNDIIYIIFWPQVLEWLGFALLPLACIIIAKHNETFSETS